MDREQEQIIRTEYSELMQKSYIDYAMSVIVSNAAFNWHWFNCGMWYI